MNYYQHYFGKRDRSKEIYLVGFGNGRDMLPTPMPIMREESGSLEKSIIEEVVRLKKPEVENNSSGMW